MPRRLAVLVAVVLLVAACTGSNDAGAPDGPTDDAFHIGLVGITTLDSSATSPASASQQTLADLLHDTLTTVSDAGIVGPGLADFRTSDLAEWRFDLGEESTFADGTAIVPDDVVFSLDRVRARGSSSLAALALENVVDIRPAGAEAVVIQLDKPSALLPELLSAPVYGIVSRASIEAATAGGTYLPDGSGEHRIEVVSGDHLRLERRRGTGPETIEVHLYPDFAAATAAFLAGDVDWVPVAATAEGEIDESMLRTDPFHALVLLAINDSAAPLDDRSMRRGLALAIDRGAMATNVLGLGGRGAIGLVPAGVGDPSGSCVAPCGPEIETAASLVEVAVPILDDLVLRLLVDGSATQEAVAGVLVGAFASIGVDLVVSSVPENTFEQLVTSGFQQLFLYSSLGVSRTPSAFLRSAWTSDSPDNLLQYDNPVVDLAVDAAARTRDQSAREKRWVQIERAVLGDAQVVPLVQLQTVSAVSARTSGIRVRVDGTLAVDDVTLDS